VTSEQGNSTDFKFAVLEAIASILEQSKNSLNMASYKVKKGKKKDSKQRKLINAMVLETNATTPNITATYTVNIQSDLASQDIVTTLNNAVVNGEFAVVLSSYCGTTVSSVGGVFNTLNIVNPAEKTSARDIGKSGMISYF
jgi:hypothetical protein